jgi:predicted translin family RNA/ssDNA-binding protein
LDGSADNFQGASGAARNVAKYLSPKGENLQKNLKIFRKIRRNSQKKYNMVEAVENRQFSLAKSAGQNVGQTVNEICSENFC